MAELLSKLGIDWRLLIAQLVNFLILFVILRRYLYRPVLGMLEERRARIARGLEDAKRAEEARHDLAEERRQLRASMETERAAVLERAADDATALRAERMTAAEAEARALLERAARDAESARRALTEEVRRELGDLVLAASRKLTADALSAEEHERLVTAALADLRAEER